MLAVGQEKVGKQNKELIRAVGAFGGGIGSTGNVCGCVTGGVALISSLYSKGEVGEKEDPRMWKLSYRLVRGFEKLAEPYGGIKCQDIARVDWRDREQIRRFYSGADGRRKICLKLVGETARMLGELLDSNR